MINFVESWQVLCLQFLKITICLFHPVNNGCIVKKKIIIIVLSSQYCVIVEAAKIRVLLQLINAFIFMSVRRKIYVKLQGRSTSRLPAMLKLYSMVFDQEKLTSNQQLKHNVMTAKNLCMHTKFKHQNNKSSINM